MCGTDDSYDRNLYPAGACATIGSGKPTGPSGTEVLFDETEDYETYRWVPLPPPPPPSCLSLPCHPLTHWLAVMTVPLLLLVINA